MKNQKLASLARTIVVMVLSLMGLIEPQTLKAQDADGRCVKFDVKTSALPNDQDQREILGTLDSNKLVSGKLYKTSRGAKFYVNNPSSLKELYYTAATKNLGYRPASLIEAFDKSAEIICGDDVNFMADNYYITQQGVVGSVKLDLFKTPNMRIRVLNGKPWYKLGDNGCMNPLIVPVTTTPPVVTPPPATRTVYLPAPRVDTVYQPAQTGCPCSTYVACTTCGGNLPMSAASGMSFNQYYQLQQTTFGQLPTSSTDRWGSFQGAYGNMYTSLGQTPGYQNAVYSATSGAPMILTFNGQYSQQCCVSQQPVVVQNPCQQPCPQPCAQPCPCNQQPAAPAPVVKQKRGIGGWIVAAVVVTAVALYAILRGQNTGTDTGGPGTQGGGLPTGGPGTQGP